MCSQSGSIQDLAACSDHSPLCISGSEADPESSRQEFVHPSSLPSDMGLRYLTTTDDVRFHPDSGTSHSPVYSLEPAVQNSSSSSSLNFSSPFPGIYQPNLNGSTYSGGGSPYYPPSNPLFSMPDIKPRLSSLNASTGLAPPNRSPALPHPGSTRDLYTGAQPQLRRTTDLLSRSPSIPGGLRGVQLSPSSTSGFASPLSMENQSGSGSSPPLGPTEHIYQLQSQDGQILKPEIFGRIDKGFFLADTDWTCYRRNYFSLNCSYTILPTLPTGNIHLWDGSRPSSQIFGFSMSISAVVDGKDGKAIELVQHTPKRDKGPQEKPARVTLGPRPPAAHSIYGDNGLGSSSRSGLYDTQGFGQNPSQPAVEATFERIQFKNATANNGKRRAAQQYYHLLVELFADIGEQHNNNRYVKIAFRMSAPMVVRGRSPGHYQSERRGSNASAGGSGGAGGAGSYTPSAGTSRTPGDINMSGTSSMQGPSYGHSYDSRSHHYRSNIAPLHIPMEPVLSAEDAKNIDDPPYYSYHPSPIYEGGQDGRYQVQLPSMDMSGSKVKQEYGNNNFVLPSLNNPQDGLGGRNCGRWEGAPSSKGYFPSTTLFHQELNIS